MNFKGQKQKRQKDLRHVLDKLFSEYMRRKDASNGYVYCFTCNEVKHWKETDLGHGIGGRKGMVRYNESICAVQCRKCNRMKGGLYDIFRLKLNALHGEGFYEKKEIEAKKEKKYSRGEVEDLIKYYKSELKKL